MIIINKVLNLPWTWICLLNQLDGKIVIHLGIKKMFYFQIQK